MLQYPPPHPRPTVPSLKQLPANDELKAIKNRLIKWGISDWTPPKVVASSLLHAQCIQGVCMPGA